MTTLLDGYDAHVTSRCPCRVTRSETAKNSSKRPETAKNGQKRLFPMTSRCPCRDERPETAWAFPRADKHSHEPSPWALHWAVTLSIHRHVTSRCPWHSMTRTNRTRPAPAKNRQKLQPPTGINTLYHTKNYIKLPSLLNTLIIRHLNSCKIERGDWEWFQADRPCESMPVTSRPQTARTAEYARNDRTWPWTWPSTWLSAVKLAFDRELGAFGHELGMNLSMNLHLDRELDRELGFRPWTWPWTWLSTLSLAWTWPWTWLSTVNLAKNG